jgi:hypothetical protein
MLSARLRRFGIEEGSFIVAEECVYGTLIQSATVAPVEIYALAQGLIYPE